MTQSYLSAKTSKAEAEVADVEEKYRQSAEMARLQYVSDDQPGIARKRWGRGFTYLDPHGEHLKAGSAERIRCEKLVIPPAWTEVWICRDPQGHLQVTGRDPAGRKQYIYHPQWEVVRQMKKFTRLIDFAEHLPLIRTQCDRDMRQRKLTRHRVLAIAVTLLEKSFIRIGNEAYLKRHGSYGLTTLTDDHVEAKSTRVVIEFMGKSNKEQHIDIRDRRIARQIRRCEELPGFRLFQYIDERGELQPIDSGDVNDYLADITGQQYTSKDFRTWGGTFTAAKTLMGVPYPAEPEAREEQLREAVRQASEALGNTPSVCREYYIHPALFKVYRSGEFEPIHRAARRAQPEVKAEVKAVSSSAFSGPAQLGDDELAVIALLKYAREHAPAEAL